MSFDHILDQKIRKYKSYFVYNWEIFNMSCKLNENILIPRKCVLKCHDAFNLFSIDR